jgi:hypothetical protein
VSLETLEKRQITRRQAIMLLAAGSTVGLIGCGSASSSSLTTTSIESRPRTASCVLTPDITVGPYFVDEKLNRSDLTTDTADSNVVNGVPLTLNLKIVEYSSSGGCGRRLLP